MQFMAYFNRQLLPYAHRWALYAILSLHGPRLGEDSTNYLEGIYCFALFVAVFQQVRFCRFISAVGTTVYQDFTRATSSVC